jgi:hypothetical protein
MLKSSPYLGARHERTDPIRALVQLMAHIGKSAGRQFCLRQAISTRTGISFLTGMAKSEGGSILNAANVAGIVPAIRVAPSCVVCSNETCLYVAL